MGERSLWWRTTSTLRRLGTWRRGTSIRYAGAIAPASTGSPLPISRLFRPEGTVEFDWTDLGPAHECVCGSNLFQVLVWFEDYEVAGYFTDMLCAFCGTKLKAPTLVDKDI